MKMFISKNTVTQTNSVINGAFLGTSRGVRGQNIIPVEIAASTWSKDVRTWACSNLVSKSLALQSAPICGWYRGCHDRPSVEGNLLPSHPKKCAITAEGQMNRFVGISYHWDEKGSCKATVAAYIERGLTLYRSLISNMGYVGRDREVWCLTHSKRAV